MTVKSKLGTLLIDVGNNTKWIKYTKESKACSKWGLREVVKKYQPNGALSNLTYTFSTNPLMGYQRVSGTLGKMRKLWKSVTNLDDPKAVEDLLNFLKKMGW